MLAVVAFFRLHCHIPCIQVAWHDHNPNLSDILLLVPNACTLPLPVLSHKPPTHLHYPLPALRLCAVPPALPSHAFWLPRRVQTFMEMYLARRANLKLLVLLVDSRREPLSADAGVLEYAEDREDRPYKILVVATKVRVIIHSQVPLHVYPYSA